MNKVFTLETKDELKKEIDHQAIRLATELKESIEDNFNKATETLLNQQILINTLEDRIDRAICYLEAGKTFETEEERETVEYMQNNLLDILKGNDSNE